MCPYSLLYGLAMYINFYISTPISVYPTCNPQSLQDIFAAIFFSVPLIIISKISPMLPPKSRTHYPNTSDTLKPSKCSKFSLKPITLKKPTMSNNPAATTEGDGTLSARAYSLQGVGEWLLASPSVSFTLPFYHTDLRKCFL